MGHQFSLDILKFSQRGCFKRSLCLHQYANGSKKLWHRIEWRGGTNLEKTVITKNEEKRKRKNNMKQLEIVLTLRKEGKRNKMTDRDRNEE